MWRDRKIKVFEVVEDMDEEVGYLFVRFELVEPYPFIVADAEGEG